jgi:hypothetical protein
MFTRTHHVQAHPSSLWADTFLRHSNDESGAHDDPDDQDEANWWKRVNDGKRK